MLSLVLALSAPAHAVDGDAILSALAADAGWSAPVTSKGVAVSTKPMPGLETPGFRATRTVDVSCDDYFVAVSDPDRHLQVNPMLLESGVITRNGDALVFYQVVKLPLVSDRYWINKAENQRDIGGVDGHHRQTWQAMPTTSYTQVREAVEDKFGAVFTEINFGMWDLMPAGAGQCTITYSAVSEPGGNIPSGAASWASEKSLPDNINSFYEAAK